MGGGLSQLFFPDNANRRDRVHQLQNELENLERVYNRIVDSTNSAFARSSHLLNLLLHEWGLGSLDALDQRVRQTTTGAVYQNWLRVRAQLDRRNQMEAVVEGLVGIAALVGVVIIIVGSFGGIKGFIAGSVLAGKILLIAQTISMILSAIFGAIERARLREAIVDLAAVRLQARRAVEEARALDTYAIAVEDTFKLLRFRHPGKDDAEIARIIVETNRLDDSLLFAMQRWNWNYTLNRLAEDDNARRAWTNEDPARWWLIERAQRDTGTLFSAASASNSGPVAEYKVPANEEGEEIVPYLLVILSTNDNKILCPEKEGNFVLAKNDDATQAKAKLTVVPSLHYKSDLSSVIISTTDGTYFSLSANVLKTGPVPEEIFKVEILSFQPDLKSGTVRLTSSSNGKFISSINTHATDKPDEGVFVVTVITPTIA